MAVKTVLEDNGPSQGSGVNVMPDPNLVHRRVFIEMGPPDNRIPLVRPVNIECLLRYSKNAEDQVTTFVNTNCATSTPRPLSHIYFQTIDTSKAARLGLAVVINWMEEHPIRGYSIRYQGRPQLKKEKVDQFLQSTSDFNFLIHVHAAILTIALKDHLGHQRVIRMLLFDHIRSTQLEPEQIIEVHNIFTATLTRDDGLVNHLVNMTVEQMDSGAMDGKKIATMSRALDSNADLASKLEVVRQKKQARITRNQNIETTRKMHEWRKRKATRVENLAIARDGGRVLSNAQAMRIMRATPRIIATVEEGVDLNEKNFPPL